MVKYIVITITSQSYSDYNKIVMSKKGLLLLLVGLYLVSLAGCFFCVRHYVREKDSRLYSEAINSLKSYFRGRDRIVVVEYSGEKVKSEQVPLENSTKM